MDKIAVLIPCYNEEKTIGKVVRDWKRTLPDARIYVYDNNSTDQTVKLALQEKAIVKFEPKQGKGNVIRRMFREIDAECYILVDGDDTYPVSSAREMVDLVLEKKADMVVGDRLSSTYTEENKRPFHNFGNTIVKAFVNNIFRSNIKDIMTGYRAFSFQFAKTIPILSEGFEIETEMTIHALDKNMLVENVVVDYRDRPEGSESKLNTFIDGFKVLKTIFNLFRFYKPFQFFSIISLILFLMTVIVFFPILVEYCNTGLVSRIPTLIVCGFTVLTAVQTFFTGLILDSHAKKNKQDFEHTIISLTLLKKNEVN